LFGKLSLLSGNAMLSGFIGLDGASKRAYGLRKIWGRGTVQKIS